MEHSTKHPFFEVTPLSKTLAGIIFIMMPFIGGWIGYNLAPVKVVEVEKEVATRTVPPEITMLGEPTERFVGTIDEVRTVFEHKDFTSYTLIKAGVSISGELNTERGYKDDVDATVFVLDWQKPEAEQKYFVRLTGSTAIQKLDVDRELVAGAALEYEAEPYSVPN